VRVIVAVGLPAEAVAKADSADSATAAVLESLPRGTPVERWGNAPVFEAEVDPGEIDRLARDPRVRAIEIDRGGQAGLFESIPLIRADVVHAAGWSGAGVTVAVVDSGIDAGHPAFAGRVVGEQCFCTAANGTGCCPNGMTEQSGAGSAHDDYGHGTHVSGILAGGGTWIPRGVAPGASIVAVKVLDYEGKLKSFTQIYRALEWIDTAHPEVRVINMSLGSNTLYAAGESCDISATGLGLTPVIEKLRARGVVITASSGNQGSSTSTALPACMTPVLGVGAVYDAPGNHPFFCNAPNASADQIACFSNSTSALDLLGPGAPIVSAWPGGKLNTLGGTSMAAPHVAGVIALMLEAAREHLTATQIETILEVTGRPIVDSRNGVVLPRVDAAAAIAVTPRPPSPSKARAVGR
jgi:subtilisin family serine protease